jgi:hypothetical protein
VLRHREYVSGDDVLDGAAIIETARMVLERMADDQP